MTLLGIQVAIGRVNVALWDGPGGEGESTAIGSESDAAGRERERND